MRQQDPTKNLADCSRGMQWQLQSNFAFQNPVPGFQAVHRSKSLLDTFAGAMRLWMRTEKGLFMRYEVICSTHLLHESMIICLVTGWFPLMVLPHPE